jgi:hypothetical protein
MTPDHPPRKSVLDDDSAPCRRPAWVEETVERARCLGVHRNQREVIGTLLGWVEAREMDLPRLIFAERTPVSTVALLWTGRRHNCQAELHWSAAEGWVTCLTLWRDGYMSVAEWPRHPANLLRTMLATVFPPERGRGPSA